MLQKEKKKRVLEKYVSLVIANQHNRSMHRLSPSINSIQSIECIYYHCQSTQSGVFAGVRVLKSSITMILKALHLQIKRHLEPQCSINLRVAFKLLSRVKHTNSYNFHRHHILLLSQHGPFPKHLYHFNLSPNQYFNLRFYLN